MAKTKIAFKYKALSTDPMLLCLANRRHDFQRGVTFEEKIDGSKVWVAHRECERCGCLRITLYEPGGFWVRISNHRYIHQQAYADLLRDMSAEDANQQVLSAMWVKTAA